MSKQRTIKFLVIIITACCGPIVALAQKPGGDTSRRQTIDITSSYKPVLRNAVKINFSASHLNADTSKTLAAYHIPPQNLFYTYQPVSLRPLALQQDSVLDLGIRNFIKAGFGNYTTPYVSAGFSFGDGKTALVNLYADYISSRGGIKNQDYTGVNIKAAGSYFTEKNELYGSALASQRDHYLYGYDHQLFDYKKSDLLQRFQLINLKAGFRNKNINETGINYDPNIDINIFRNQDKARENSFAVELPVDKTFADAFTIKVAAKADITSYSTVLPVNNVSFNNNIYSIAPELIYAKPMFNIHVGITPAWDNNSLSVFPNIYGEMKLRDKPILVQAGYVGGFIKNTFQHLSGINPYLQTISAQQNTKEKELYGGVKATLGSHFNFSAKASWITYHNFPFFINDTTDGKTFRISNESRVYDFRLHGDLSFISQDKFTITTGLTFNGYHGMKDNDRAWGTSPVELNGSLRWWAFKRVLIKSDLNFFSGGAFLMKDGSDVKLGGGADLSAGVELGINKQFSAWLDVNNIFNNKYQRWYNYPVYGLNLLAGVIFKF